MSFFCSCNKKQVTEVDISSYIIGDAFIYFLPNVEVIRAEMPQAYNNLLSGDYDAAGMDFLKRVKELEEMQEKTKTSHTQFFIWNNALAISYDLMDETEKANEIFENLIQLAEEDGAGAEHHWHASCSQHL